MDIGDRVSWSTAQGRTQGKIVERKTKPFTFAKQKFKASEDEPYYLVESEKTGAKAAHDATSLRQLKSKG